jgi:hypothetical protein
MGDSPSFFDVTNAEKLSGSWLVGTIVHVSDGFTTTGLTIYGSDYNYLYVENGTLNGKRNYTAVDDDPDQKKFSWSPAPIYYGLPDGWYYWSNNLGYFLWSTDDVADPWLASSAGRDVNLASVLLTHPAVQQLAAPDTSQGGVFVSGGTQDGVYTNRAVYNDKPTSNLLGQGEDNQISAITWFTDISTSGFGPAVAGFIIFGNDGLPAYYSTSNVATPDLASNWKDPAIPPKFVIDFNNLDVSTDGAFYGTVGNVNYIMIGFFAGNNLDDTGGGHFSGNSPLFQPDQHCA